MKTSDESKSIIESSKNDLVIDNVDINEDKNKEASDKGIKKLIIVAFAIVITLMLIFSIVLYSSSGSLTKVLKFWFDFGAVGAVFMGIEKLSESEIGAALILFGGAAGYIIYCLC